MTLAVFIFLNPATNLKDLINTIPSSLTFQEAILLAVVSYFLGGLIQGITWKCFVIMCKFFRRDWQRFKDDAAFQKIKDYRLLHEESLIDKKDFEHKLALLVQEKIGIPQNIEWLDFRLHSYLKENNRPSSMTVDSHQATHIMYRNLSFGFLFLGVVLSINSFRSFSFDKIFLLVIAVVLSYIALLRAISFKQWYRREALFGFYFAASNEKPKS